MLLYCEGHASLLPPWQFSQDLEGSQKKTLSCKRTIQAGRSQENGIPEHNPLVCTDITPPATLTWT